MSEGYEVTSELPGGPAVVVRYIGFGLSIETGAEWTTSIVDIFEIFLDSTFRFLFLGFSPPESLPGDDVLCRLLPRSLPSVCFFFFFSDRVRPRFVLV